MRSKMAYHEAPGQISLFDNTLHLFFVDSRVWVVLDLFLSLKRKTKKKNFWLPKASMFRKPYIYPALKYLVFIRHGLMYGFVFCMT